MEAAKYILKRLIMARDGNHAMIRIKQKYPRAKLITYKVKTSMYELPKEKRNYNNRYIYVWFIKDVKEIREDI